MSAPKHHWLVAANVISSNYRGEGRQRGLNTLVTTDKPIFTRHDIATAQDGIMRRFVTETPQVKGDKISDVFVVAVNNLGLMTTAEFEGSFAAAADADDGQTSLDLH